MMAAPFGLSYAVDARWIDPSRISTVFLGLGTSVLLGGFALNTYVATICWKAVNDRLPWTEHMGAFTVALIISGAAYLGFFGLMMYQLIRQFV